MSNDNIFNLDAFKKQLEEIKEQLDKHRETTEQASENIPPNDRWGVQKEALGKMLDAYDALLPKGEMAKIFGVAAEQLEEAANTLKDLQKVVSPDKGEEGEE